MEMKKSYWWMLESNGNVESVERLDGCNSKEEAVEEANRRFNRLAPYDRAHTEYVHVILCQAEEDDEFSPDCLTDDKLEDSEVVYEA